MSENEMTIRCLICGEEEQEEVTPMLIRPMGSLFEDEVHQMGIASVCPSCWDVVRERMFMFEGTEESLARMEEETRQERIRAEVEKLTGELGS